jgi:4a-hydroxytetrahydrobiopterin dehydratase
MKIENLTQKKCQPCEGIGQPLTKAQADDYLKNTPKWQIKDSTIYREYVMKDFLAAVSLVNKIAKVAEEENHHPDVHITGYRKLRVELSTHAVKGLTENDFILAAKIDELPADLKS